MRLASLMMYISPPLIFILYVCVGRSDAAPHDASPLSGQPGAASLTWGSSLTDVPGPGPESRLAPGSLISLTPSPVIVSGGPTAAPPAAAFQPPPADPTTGLTPAAAKAQIPAPLPRSPGKRSTDARPSLLAPEKRLQTLGSAGSVVAQRTDNDAWAAADGTAGPAAASVESQEALCNCSSGAEGVLDPDECDRPSGQCSCVLGYTGLQCEDCEERHFTNGSSGCLPCACDSFGAVNPLCDSSGTCVCKTGVYGPKCDECHPGFFHFSSTGCRPCQCQSHSSSCLPQSGACMNCEGNTQGSNCEECKPGSYRGPGDAPTAACAPCPCSNATSTGTCHAGPGGPPRCDQCLPPYGGPHCDRCSAGFSKASGLCVPCDCSGNADPQGPPQLCDPDTGRCLRCSNSTTGAQCQLCAPGLTGDARAHNCTRPALRLLPTPALTPSSEAPHLHLQHRDLQHHDLQHLHLQHHDLQHLHLQHHADLRHSQGRPDLHVQQQHQHLLLLLLFLHHAGAADQPGRPHGQHHRRPDGGLLDAVQHHHPGRDHPGGAGAAGLRGRRVHVPRVPEPQAQRALLDHRAEGGQHQLQQLPRQHPQRRRVGPAGGRGQRGGAQRPAGAHHAGQLLQGLGSAPPSELYTSAAGQHQIQSSFMYACWSEIRCNQRCGKETWSVFPDMTLNLDPGPGITLTLVQDLY
ncbi:multiple epidermal growth factor-like domains protein 9 isoform X1 [Pseudoliparis swirei]|uniref:multiple epidermal growth factor-like domains protein 9 isoform X1 n=1 Tax=Pseudoliparis swirei TaxID=2059687 RepID=UPI0024BDCC47|nr:multiple epidermal growth factor-like domains protein 9 isoform X1 [Pseudoliparis swirei]